MYSQGSVVIMSDTAAWARRGWGGGCCSFAEPTDSCCTTRPLRSFLRTISLLFYNSVP